MPSPEKPNPYYTSAFLALIGRDAPAIVNLPVAAFARDLVTLERRVACEGESFFTKTLPALGKSIDYALQERSPLAVSGFKKRSRRSALPAFLQALLGRVFLDSGHLRDEPCIMSIRLLRQICFWCKKVEKGFTDESKQRAMVEFIEIDQTLPEIGDLCRSRILRYAKGLIRRIFGNIPRSDRLNPKHGPGTVAWSTGKEKRDMQVAYSRLERVFRPIPFFFSLRDASENPHRLLNRIQCEYGLDRLAFVEKDSSGPRLIGLTPAEYMWCQQALKGFMYHYLESHPITGGRVNFTDQSVNQKLTSLWQKYDTLDMSSASDRNSYQLVKFLFEGTWIWPYLDASRTPGIVLPDGSVLWYKKFAPMGSAVCFPVEAMVFYAIAVAALKEAGYPALLAQKNTFVYGDDLIVPHGYFAALKSAFEPLGLKFSDSKCCVSGKFRESCGVDAYDGHNVTPLRLRRPYMRDGLDVVSMVEHINRLYAHGYTAAAAELRLAYLREYPLIREMRIPFSKYALPILSWLDFTQETVRYEYKDSQRTVTGWVTRDTRRVSAAWEGSHLRESLSTRGPVGAKVRWHNGSIRRFLSLRFASYLHKKKVLVPDGVQEGLRGQETSHNGLRPLVGP